MRGHYDIAKAIFEIAQAQYQPQDQTGTERYTMRGESGDSDYYSEDGEDDDGSIQLFKEIIDDQYTIENIGEVATQVKSDVAPIQLLSRHLNVARLVRPEIADVHKPEVAATEEERALRDAFSLLQYAVWADNPKLVNFLLDLGVEYSALNIEDDFPRAFTINAADFDYAIRLGRTRLLAEFIKRIGAGIPLEDLVKKSGVEMQERPKYYQGLSVHGKKRADWAAAGRGMRHMPQAVDTNPPLLRAAFTGSIESVEWFASDAPLRYYKGFAETNKHDKRVKILAQAKAGFEGSISSWLSTRCE